MSWTCPYCQHAQLLGRQNVDRYAHEIDDGYEGEGRIVSNTISIRCLNENCKRRSLSFALHAYTEDEHRIARPGKRLAFWRLLPPSEAKPQPDYIPKPIVQDYNEACLIRDLSPKASATLSRRCLQSMIRDFCDIQKKTLNQAILELKRLAEEDKLPRGVDADTIGAIDGLRELGNIGAHMEADINLILDVDENEAAALIALIELLFVEWYVAREDRKNRIAAVVSAAASKKERPSDQAGTERNASATQST